MAVSDGLIPLVIGVTGHRNPVAASVDELKARVIEIFDRLDASAPNTPFVLLSPLARGCDRIAAHAALEFKRRNSAMGIEVIGVLPFRLDDYRRDFAHDPADAAEFESLLQRVAQWFELPARSDAIFDAQRCVCAGPDRDCHYRRLGLYIALQSQVMIAMWDGVRNGLVGGTAEVVDFCQDSRARGFDCGIPFRNTTLLLAPPDKTPIACIPTAREGGSAASDAAHALAAASFDERFKDALRDLDLLNKRLAATTANSWRSPMLDVPVTESAGEPWKRLIDRYRRLDAMSSAAKTSHLRYAMLIPSLATVGVISFQWFSSYATGNSWGALISLVVYFGLLAVAVGAWLQAVKRQRTEWVFVHTRALAEAMRVQLAWTGSGIEEVAPDLYLARRHADVAFLREQLRAAIFECAIVNARGGCDAGTKIGSGWMKEQEEYFRLEGTAMRRRRRALAKWKWFKGTLVVLAIITSLALLTISIADLCAQGQLISEWANLGCFVAGSFLASIVGVDYVTDVTLDEEDLDVAKHMHEVFARAQSRMIDQPGIAREILRAMGKEALDEHADWFARHREKLHLPDAG